MTVGERQGNYQRAVDYVDRFVDFVRAVIMAGEGHFVNAGDKPFTPEQAQRYGWRPNPDKFGGECYLPEGKRIGWARGNDVFLEPTLAYRAAQRMAVAHGDAIGIRPRTLWQRLDERGLLVERDGDHKTVKLTLPGSQRVRALHMSAAVLFPMESGAKGAGKTTGAAADAGAALKVVIAPASKEIADLL